MFDCQISQMEHKKFMEALFRAISAAMHRDESDPHANKILKFCSSFIASFGEENSTHPIIQDAFDELLSVSFLSIEFLPNPSIFFSTFS